MALAADKGSRHRAANAEQGRDVGRGLVGSASERAFYRGSYDKQQQKSEHTGDQNLRPERRAEQSGDETADAAAGEHQEGEIDGDHFDDHKEQQKRYPEDPGVHRQKISDHPAAPLTTRVP